MGLDRALADHQRLGDLAVDPPLGDLRGDLALARGHYEEALAAAERATQDPHGLGTPMWLLADLVEASVRSGEPGRAAGAAALLAREPGVLASVTTR